MSGKIYRALRVMAKEEMSQDNVPAKEVVWSGPMLRHSPGSVHAMYKQMKGAFKKLKARTSQPKFCKVRKHKPSGFHRNQVNAPVALIISPLKQIANARPGGLQPDGSYAPSWQYSTAKFHASIGNGGRVQQLARAWIPA